MFSVGVDIIEISRIAGALDRWGTRFLNKIYTPAEVAYCKGGVQELAARFAAKESVSKALGTGIRGITWREMEILAEPSGKPLVRLHGNAKEVASRLGLRHFEVSLSHTRELAIAFVVADGERSFSRERSR
jgi:holo-[acyl-carrier protein] synthase